ncbi:hypothetical protein MA04_01053 [Alcanivorax balearicus MACL04]|uniref:Uncharacterized protein n=1 Tax=Alloalcanivorax balearicus MACL04 TaxID=1177182 RepID=A0ABT2QW80_9GAMM|nr:hypothetical protein [Alloalcanivorax balearicus MACL04]
MRKWWRKTIHHHLYVLLRVSIVVEVANKARHDDMTDEGAEGPKSHVQEAFLQFSSGESRCPNVTPDYQPIQSHLKKVPAQLRECLGSHSQAPDVDLVGEVAAMLQDDT